ncbi:cytidylyltransferase domain-containing protein [Novispirillum sp. DQ9]|uniref:acylneuraminate cytidylyltransferase family protein n=1 Tax=Novispirillum sp. DQ9 TaxID=3398612 RepID=UPI003C7BDB18
MHVLAVIPARGGSKGIPRKNLTLLAGRPLVAHSVAHALESSRITRTIVSTEDAEIAEAARAAGAEVPFLRPAHLAGDLVLDLPVFEHVLDELEAREGYRPDIVVHLRPTAPFRRAGWIDAAVDLLTSTPEADSVRSVSPPAQHPYRVFRKGANGFLEPVMGHEHPEPYLLRRQDLPDMFYYNCVIDVTRPQTIRNQNSMTGKNMLPFIMDADDAFDIDTPRDLAIARCLLETEL